MMKRSSRNGAGVARDMRAVGTVKRVVKAAVASLAAVTCMAAMAVPAQAKWVLYIENSCMWVDDPTVGEDICPGAFANASPAFGAKKSNIQYKGYDHFRDFRGGLSVKRQDMAAFLYRWAGSPAFTPSAKDKAYFADVTSATPHAKEIWWMASKGISTGWQRADGSRVYRGMGAVVRQDMAAFLHRLVGSNGPKVDAPSQISFTDVNADTPHAEDIAWLASVNVTEGWKQSNGAHVFRGTRAIVRQDMAAFLNRLAGIDLNSLDAFTDSYWSGYLSLSGDNITNAVFVDVSDRTPHWKEIAWMMYYGISLGWPHKRPTGLSTCSAKDYGKINVLTFGNPPSSRKEFVNRAGVTECRPDGYWYPVMYHSIDEVPSNIVFD
ncbi:deoxyribonuclease [Bifidobacterium ramosum]|nr:deoxyribonuclease [Bifidobacterium ramosum]